jgi:hypothetical protein
MAAKILLIIVVCICLFMFFKIKFMKDNNENVVNSYLHFKDSLNTAMDNLYKGYLEEAEQHRQDTQRLVAEMKDVQAQANETAKKNNKLIDQIRKISNDSAHRYMKENYTPVEALTKIFELDSCMAGGEFVEQQLKLSEELNTERYQQIIYLETVVDSAIDISTACTNKLEACGNENKEMKEENDSQKKWIKGLGVTSAVSVALNTLLLILLFNL